MQSVTWNSVLGTSTLVGFIEEVPYTLLFLVVHLPGWMALHMVRADLAATIFIFGVVMALAFRYSDSLWAPIVTHSANDFLSFVIFHV